VFILQKKLLIWKLYGTAKRRYVIDVNFSFLNTHVYTLTVCKTTKNIAASRVSMNVLSLTVRAAYFQKTLRTSCNGRARFKFWLLCILLFIFFIETSANSIRCVSTFNFCQCYICYGSNSK